MVSWSLRSWHCSFYDPIHDYAIPTLVRTSPSLSVCLYLSLYQFVSGHHPCKGYNATPVTRIGSLHPPNKLSIFSHRVEEDRRFSRAVIDRCRRHLLLSRVNEEMYMISEDISVREIWQWLFSAWIIVTILAWQSHPGAPALVTRRWRKGIREFECCAPWRPQPCGLIPTERLERLGLHVAQQIPAIRTVIRTGNWLIYRWSELSFTNWSY